MTRIAQERQARPFLGGQSVDRPGTPPRDPESRHR